MKRYILSLVLAGLMVSCSGVVDGGYPGSYQANLPDGRVVRLRLAASGAATLVEDPNDGQAPLVSEGSWLGSSETLEVSVNGDALTFARGADDSLALVDVNDPLWGADGTTGWIMAHATPGTLTLYPITAFLGEWVWQQTAANGQVTEPSTPGAFIITFTAEGRMHAVTDCNSGNGGFQVGAGKALSMPVIATTRMFCEGSNEGDFYAQLGIVDSWSLTADGVLELHLGGDGGTMEFVPEA